MYECYDKSCERYKTDLSGWGTLNCVDIDECTEVNRCDLEHSVCVNHDGGYKCQCHVGYKD